VRGYKGYLGIYGVYLGGNALEWGDMVHKS
jgi:hypothetical protein